MQLHHLSNIKLVRLYHGHTVVLLQVSMVCLITSGKNIKGLLIDCKQQKCIGYVVYVKPCCASTVSSPIPFVGVVRQAFGVGPPRLWRD